MSPIWWRYVKEMVRRYPKRVERLRERRERELAARRLTGVSGELPPESLGAGIDREMEAVRRALEETARLPEGLTRLELIRMALLENTHTLEGAGQVLNLSYSTARRYHAEFLWRAARLYGLERAPGE